MGTIQIYVDSSTKPSNGTQYGESIAAWLIKWDRAAIFWNGGVHYIHRSGPKKTFYEGVIRALECALPDANNGYGDRVELYGDCQTVINQLQGVWGVGQLQSFYKRVKALEAMFKEKVTYHYLNETDATYKKVDRLSKLARGSFRGR